jgi:ComF family protein
VTLLDLLFPPRCAGCGRQGVAWCPACAAAVEPVDVTPLEGVALIAGGRFGGPLQRAIHTYKYRGRRGLARQLTPALALAIRAAEPQVDALGFVPLHPQRYQERGFNQAHEIAKLLGKALGLPILPGLERTRITPAQVGLTQAERRQNLTGAFAWQGPIPAPQRLGLVDDVCTTGATLTAAAEAIRLAGGSVTAFLVLARAQTLPGPVVTLPEQSACS